VPDQHTLEETERAMTERVSQLALDFRAAHAISSLYRAANAARAHLTNRVLRPHDLTWTGFLVLWLLWIWGQMETRNVAESVGISKATLTGVTNTLVARGLVERIPGTVDRRLVSLSLTAQGQELLHTLYPEFNQAEAQMIATISEGDVRTMTESLRTIVNTVESGG
jgi:MarR family transcriptional regulator, organic hydroperoxide resistance regulator